MVHFQTGDAVIILEDYMFGVDRAFPIREISNTNSQRFNWIKQNCDPDTTPQILQFQLVDQEENY